MQSFQGRFLIVAVMLAVALFAMAVYTKKIVSDDSRDSQILIMEYKSAEENIGQINDLYLTLKSALYQHALLLTPELKTLTLKTMETLGARFEIFSESDFFKHYTSSKKYVVELGLVIKSLDKEVRQVLKLQESAITRYPAVKILLNDLQPANRYFIEQLGIARDEATDIQSQKVADLVNVLNKVRYFWARRISEVRLFIANRSGAFGVSEKVLPKNITSEKIFGEQIEKLLNEGRELSRHSERSVLLSNAMDEMILTNRHYSVAFKKAAKLFMQKGWRADVFYLESRIEPLIKQNQGIVKSIEQVLSAKMGKMVEDSVETSTVVSSYISWFVGIVYLFIMMAYFAFEKSIRQPLSEVSKALDAQGNNEMYDIVPKKYYVSESEVLIEAFVSMKEQVDSRQLRLQTILQNVADGIVISDHRGIIETFNPAAERLFGRCCEEVIGKRVSILLGSDSNITSDTWLSLIKGIAYAQKEPVEIKLSRPNGDMFYAAINSSSMKHLGETYYISVVADITQHKMLTDRLQNLADLDSLTGLHNRRYFTEELDRLVERSHRREFYSFSLLFVDLDNFKYINDSHGHHVGDRILIEVSTLLQGKVRKGDLLARLGGDEFAVILYDVDGISSVEIANKYLQQLSGFTFYEQGTVLDVGCSIGVAMMDRKIKNKNDFLMRADFACQLAKQTGKNRVHTYSRDDDLSKDQMLGHIGIAQKIRDALRDDTFRLLLQPIRSTSTNKIYCYEVLLRMVGDNNKDIMPFGFLPSAERFDLMIDIDRWIVKNAISLLSGFQKDYPGMIISINLSAQSIGDPEIIRIIEDALSQFAIPASALVFEITESIAISHMDRASQFLEYLRGLGCKTALDDFGAGYSSYAYLKDLPADFVKIDGGFVRNMDENEINFAMVKSMNEIAHVMGKKTIAEFVENEAVLSLLKEIGVDYVQGFLLGKPEPKPVVDHQSKIIPIR